MATFLLQSWFLSGVPPPHLPAHASRTKPETQLLSHSRFQKGCKRGRTLCSMLPGTANKCLHKMSAKAMVREAASEAQMTTYYGTFASCGLHLFNMSGETDVGIAAVYWTVPEYIWSPEAIPQKIK